MKIYLKVLQRAMNKKGYESLDLTKRRFHQRSSATSHILLSYNCKITRSENNFMFVQPDSAFSWVCFIRDVLFFYNIRKKIIILENPLRLRVCWIAMLYTGDVQEFQWAK